MNQEGLKVLSIVAENFKNIDYKEVKFDGKSAMIVGANGAGKSSFLQAICSPVDSNYVPQEPIKKGEERGSIELEIGGTLHGEPARYNIGMYFSPEHQKGRLNITGADGEAVGKSKGIVSDIVGNIGFDITEFLRMGTTSSGQISKPGVREQIETLKGLMPREGVELLYTLDQEYTKKYEERANVNRDISGMKARLSTHSFTQEDITKYSKKVDTAPIEAKLNDIGKAIETYSKVSNFKENIGLKADRLQEELKSIEERAEQIKSELKEIHDKYRESDAWLAKNTKPSAEALNEELNSSRYHNSQCDEVAKLDADNKALEGKESESQEITERLKTIQEEKTLAFKQFPLPVEGLEFSEEQILYKGLPFNADQHPTSELISVGVKLAMAMNPNLRLIIVRDGSLLGESVLKYILTECEKNGYQVLIEMVNQDDSSEMEVEFVESEVK